LSSLLALRDAAGTELVKSYVKCVLPVGEEIQPGHAGAVDGAGVSKEEMLLALADVRSDAEISDEEELVPVKAEEGCLPQETRTPASSRTEHEQGGLRSDSGDVVAVSSPRPEETAAHPSASSSAFAARSAFRKSYSKQLLPLSDEKPVLGFSVYNKTALQRRYAGLTLPGLRGSDREVERARARIVREVEHAHMQEQAASGRRLGVKEMPELAHEHGGELGPHQGSRAVAVAYAKCKPDLLRDPWGCVMAGQDGDNHGASIEMLALTDTAAMDISEEPSAEKGPGREVRVSEGDAPMATRLQASPGASSSSVTVSNGGDAAAGGTSWLADLRAGLPASQPPASPPQRAAIPAGRVSGSLPAAAAASGATSSASLAQTNAQPATALDAPSHWESLQGSSASADAFQLPKMAEGPTTALQGLDDSMPNENQWSIIKELAGGARFHDPARDRRASSNQAKSACLIEVRKLRFCHETISPQFTHGSHRGLAVLTLLQSLHAGRVKPEELPPMVVMRTHKQGTTNLDVVCGNRRLYCLKRYAAEASTSVSSWCIVYDLKAQDTPRSLVMKYILAATTGDGGSIKLRDL